MPQGWARALGRSAGRRAPPAATSRADASKPIAGGGELMHVATAVRNAGGQITGVVVASDYLSGELAERRGG